ncbi:hypothetical protein ABEB36_012079 [Hypothenemus hampei]|uniref:Uncharacterized protein n=1 Tax=Hypothenemus hampei TaxID=57062 RepID=A0ABD1EAA5_HYPHA
MIKSTQVGFYDLNLPESCLEPGPTTSPKTTLEFLFNLGYRTIAINQQIDTNNTNVQPNRKKKKGEPRDLQVDCVPVPFNIQELERIATELNVQNATFLTRLTIIFSNQDMLQKYLKSNNFKKYDIVAVIPTTMAALQYVCSNLEVDILSFIPEENGILRLNRKMYGQLVDKGFHFELTYSPAIQDSAKRKMLIRLSHMYHTHGKSKNIIFSSGATHQMLIRGPYDVISLGFLFGLNELQCKNSVLHCPRNVLLNALKRRHGKALMLVENIQSMEIKDAIAVDSDSNEEGMETDEPLVKKPKQ